MTDQAYIAELEAQIERLTRQNFLLGQRSALREIEGLADCQQDSAYIPGCGEFDTRDSKGQPLRPAVNDAGEPWWM